MNEKEIEAGVAALSGHMMDTDKGGDCAFGSWFDRDELKEIVTIVLNSARKDAAYRRGRRIS